jgi:ABC-type multidrug transport system fused ATPase/permease subunit
LLHRSSTSTALKFFPDGNSGKLKPFAIFMRLLPFVWPEERPDLRRRVILAAIVLVIAKVITVLTPLAYKAAVDWFTAAIPGGAGAQAAAALTVVPIMLIVAYAVGRMLMVAFTQIRDVLFTEVGQNAVRALSNQTFEHLHRLSLRFHLERKTGGLSRIIERGRTAVELIIRMGVLNSLPTVLELVLVLAMTTYFFGWLFSAIIALTLVVYTWFTFKASEWRISIRREMNDSDTEANTKAIDSLLNYETVKYFGNEGWEQQRFDASMIRYEKAAVRTYRSLALLNTGQTVIYSIGLMLCMLLAAWGITRSTHTVGDFVMINAMLIQLYMPLNFLGMIYRELRQGLVDIEAMFDLLGQSPEVEDKPGAKALIVSQGHIRF